MPSSRPAKVHRLLPWQAKTMATWAVEMFGGTLVGKDGVELSTSDALEGKVVAVYFSAHWCVDKIS